MWIGTIRLLVYVMIIKHLEELLKQSESASLEFKEQIDLESNRGKAKFVKEVLALANSPVHPAYLLLGVQDKTKKIIGIEDITDERLQHIIAEWCHPPVDFNFHVLELQGKKVGVLEIFGGEILHTFSRPTSFEDTDGKNKPLTENQVFIRRGSTTGEATLPEIIKIAQRGRADLSKIASRLDKTNEWLEEIAYARSSSHELPSTDYLSREPIETTFVSMGSGLVLGWIYAHNEPSLTALMALPITFIICISSSVFRLTHFGLIHNVAVSVLAGMAFGLWFNFGVSLPFVSQWILVSPLLFVVLNGIVGAVIGFVASIILMFWRPFGS